MVGARDPSRENSAHRILSLDGGGVHALSFLPIIEHIENFLACEVAASGQFQMFVGTSTGAIVAAGLKLGMRASRLVKLYNELARRVFVPSPPWERYFGKYSSQHLKHALEEAFVDVYGGDPTWEELAFNSPNNVMLMVVLWDISAGRTAFLSTDLATNKAEDHLLHGARLSAIITACCSAPTYFAPQAFFATDGKNRVYCDGGITGLNNPAAAAAAVVWEGIQQTGAPLQVISLGTGKTEMEYPVSAIQTWGFAEAAKNTIDALFGSTEVLMDQFYWVFGRALGVDRYFRAEPSRGAGEFLDYTEDLSYLYRKLEEGRIKYRLFPSESTVPGQPLNGAKITQICDLLGLRSSSSAIPEPGGTRRCERTGLTAPVEARELRGNLWVRPDLLGAVGGAVVFLLLFGLGWLSFHWARADVGALTLKKTELEGSISELYAQRDRIKKELTDATELAKQQARIATSRRLAAFSASERNKRLDRSLLLAVEALRTENTFEARDSLFKALQDRPGLRTFLHIEEGFVRGVAVSPDGETIAVRYYKRGGGGVVLWDVAGRKRLSDNPLPVKENSDAHVAFSPDGKTIAAGYDGDGDGGVVLWDVAGRKRLSDDPLPVKEGSVTDVAFGPDGKTIAAGYSRIVGRGMDSKDLGGGLVLWDVAGRKRLSDDPLPVKEGSVWGVAFSPDGKTIAAGYYNITDSGVVLWDVAGRRRLADDPLRVQEGFVTNVAFSLDGKTIAAGYSKDFRHPSMRGPLSSAAGADSVSQASRTSPSPSASVDLAHLRPVRGRGGCATRNTSSRARGRGRACSLNAGSVRSVSRRDVIRSSTGTMSRARNSARI